MSRNSRARLTFISGEVNKGEMVLTRLLVGVRRCPHVVWRQCRRNIGVTAPCYQQVATDPIQKLFLDKVHEYSSKSKAAGGKLVDVNPQVEKELQEELGKISRMYGADKQDMTKFPTFNFTDPDLKPVGVELEAKDKASEGDVEAEKEEEAEEKYYWEI
ncbi:ATP synthase-coupling factor 6, mitochondrial [Lamellibrachia satsuma]|nr:ATP synthase-coupling factor 6, mitochondrial [Lamellibrachia satsuma]